MGNFLHAHKSIKLGLVWKICPQSTQFGQKLFFLFYRLQNCIFLHVSSNIKLQSLSLRGTYLSTLRPLNLSQLTYLDIYAIFEFFYNFLQDINIFQKVLTILIYNPCSTKNMLKFGLDAIPPFFG